jgi:hypothetical protein
MARDIHTYIGVFLIVIGLLPFLGINFGMLSTIVHVLTIASGIAILLTR